jgi:hypothetical protein
MRYWTECCVQDTRQLTLGTHIDRNDWFRGRCAVTPSTKLYRAKLSFNLSRLADDLDDISQFPGQLILLLNLNSIPFHPPSPVMPGRDDFRMPFPLRQQLEYLSPEG